MGSGVKLCRNDNFGGEALDFVQNLTQDFAEYSGVLIQARLASGGNRGPSDPNCTCELEMKLLPVFALLLALPMLNGCAIFGVAALGTAVAEGATADENSEASNGIVARQWTKACNAIDGTVNPRTGECNGDLFGHFFGGDDEPAPAEPEAAQPQAAQPQAAAPEPVYAEPQPAYAASDPAYAQPQPVQSQPLQ